MAIYRSDGDVVALAFVGFSYVDLVLLFVCLRLFERSEPNSPARGHLKAAVWLLTTYKVAAIMPVPVQVLVWAIACATVLGGFYAFFVHRESKLRLQEGELSLKAKAQHYLELAVISIAFSSNILLHLLVVLDPSMEEGNGAMPFTASLLLALATLLCGNTLTLLCLPRHGFSGSQLRDAAVKWLASGCVSLYTFTSLALFWELPRKPYPYVAVDLAVDLLVMLVFLPLQRYHHQPRHSPQQGGNSKPAYDDQQQKVELRNASRTTAGVTVVAAGCLIGAVSDVAELTSGAATKAAVFLVFCTAVLGLLLMVLSKKVAMSIDSQPRPRRGAIVRAIWFCNAMLLCVLALACTLCFARQITVVGP